MGLGDGVKRELVLSDVKVIEMLIRFKKQLSSDLKSSFGQSGTRMEDELAVTYSDLENLVERCNFNETQKEIIRLIEHDYNDLEIARELNLAVGVVRRRLNTIFNRIKTENDLQWEKWIATEHFELKTKKCTKCKEELPVTLDFFRANADRQDGFRTRCKRCES